MVWEQVATVLVTVVPVVLAGTLYTNPRLDDTDGRTDDLRGDMNARFAELREDLREIRALLQEALKAKAPWIKTHPELPGFSRVRTHGRQTAAQQQLESPWYGPCVRARGEAPSGIPAWSRLRAAASCSRHGL